MCFITFYIKQKDSRKELLLPGIRNILFIIPALFLSMAHSVGWTVHDPGWIIADEYGNAVPNYDKYSNIASQFERYDDWQAKYLFYAFFSALLIYVIFLLIDKLMKKRSK